jgi:hypothetical protein
MPTTHQDLLAQIAGKFGQVLPDSREKCLVVILLHLKIEGGMMDGAFTEGDLDATMKEVEEYLLRDKSIRPERPTRELTGYFLSYDPRSSRYRLTRYGEDFATLILGKVRGAMNPESLKLIFRNTFQLREGDYASIEALELWHDTQFVQTSKRRIEEVLDGLEESMNREFEALGPVMKALEDSFKELLTEFRERFAAIQAKTDDMRETIEARQEVIATLKSLEKQFEHDRDAWERYLYVEGSILKFFDRIDERLASVYVHVDHAVKKLSLLYENFHYKRAHRMLLERFLQRLLTESTQDGDLGIHLPQGLRNPEVLSMREKFVTLPEQLELGRKRARQLRADVDPVEVELEWDRQRALLERQGLVDVWTTRIEAMVREATEAVDVSALLYNIAAEGVATEVVLSVASNLLWRFGDQPGFELTINPPEMGEKELESMVLWKMSINPTAS